MLVLSRKENERIVIGGGIAITICSIDGGTVRLGIEAPPDVEIWREELSAARAASDCPRRHEKNSDLGRLCDAVAEMRHAQIEYFRTRSQSALRAAQSAERKVDRLLAELTKPTLFG